MKLLSLPDMTQHEVYAACVSDISDTLLSSKLSLLSQDVADQAETYEQLARSGQLYTLPYLNRGGNDQIALRNATKGEFLKLYSNHMVGTRSPGRHYYDRIKTSIPRGICPYCGFGHITTLDHILSKSRYPSLSVLPANLIPACKDCNDGKGAESWTLESQISHPYFESRLVETERWLYATISHDTYPTVQYVISTPASWDPGLANRIRAYFKTTNLAQRFSIQAGSILDSVAVNISVIGTETERREYLLAQASTEKRVSLNSWRSAFFDAAAHDHWFYSSGFESLVPERA